MNAAEIQELICRYGDCRASGDTYNGTVLRHSIVSALAELEALAAAPAIPQPAQGDVRRNVTAAEDQFLRNAAVRSSKLVAPGRLAAPSGDAGEQQDHQTTSAGNTGAPDGGGR